MKIKNDHPVSSFVAHEAVQIAGWTNNTHDPVLFSKKPRGDGYLQGAELRLSLARDGVLCEWKKDGKTVAKLVPFPNVRELTLTVLEE